MGENKMKKEKQMTLNDIKGLVMYYAEKLEALNKKKYELMIIQNKTDNQLSEMDSLDIYIKDMEREVIDELILSPKIY
jgi:hypothetical protein